MGSYCGISFGTLSISMAKSYVPDDWAALFQECDRRTEPDQSDDTDPDYQPGHTIRYCTDRSTFFLRLSLLGATDEAMRIAFEAWLQTERESWQDYAETWTGNEQTSAAIVCEILEALNFQEWKRRAARALHTRYGSNAEELGDPAEKYFRDFADNFLHFDGDGSLISLRALLHACPDAQEVSLDVSELVRAGYYEEDTQICDQMRRNLPLVTNPLSPTIILGEGSSDLLVLRRALAALHPELVDYFSFFDHAEFAVDGGTAYLIKFLKAFAGARMVARIVAVFDNDTAGVQAHGQALALSLPANFIIVRLPDIELARRYPTIGPSGPAELDVNGSAAGIELYLGQDALAWKGGLRPVRWTGYVHVAGKYQGEVEGKSDIMHAFLCNVKNVGSKEEAKECFPELAEIWQHILQLVEQNAGEQYISAHHRLIGSSND
ncbi:HEPN/Toprim-associated domain-containing protein [Plastoroseomonas hellenica]|uniref:HEPN/Toprim-associated domain-containing protein n=1 Tax=Plastoroseomonas hellenica TaxID=2687306 RepID=UPI001BAB954E|nr:HEPN/Toprim-associated domain-containing protein [Plastoroseomonas hellenica]MBR0644837.1 toprim domain-containing protein [Plastoroseomonas hellenica]